ncbi:MAG: sugar ABC transporter ATP-binding protein [Candidatus Caldatribacteriaceae bacterium]
MQLLEMKGIKKFFPGVVALNGVDFDLRKGEVHCLVGENGAGKSTLVKILSGAYPDYYGEILLEGQPVKIDSPRTSRNLGIAAIQQHRDLVPTLNAVENMFLGQEIKKGRTIFWQEEYRRAKEIIAQFACNIDLEIPVSQLSVSDQEIVAICKALLSNCKILILDETAAPLDRQERLILFQKIRELAAKGLGIVYISHDLEEIFEVGDRVSVLKDGQKVGTREVSKTDLREIVKMMIGLEQESLASRQEYQRSAQPLLRVNNLTVEGKLRGLSFDLWGGEILGIYGLAGAGIEYIGYALFGIVPISRESEIYLHGQRVHLSSPERALKMGIALIPDDRRTKGLVTIRSVGQNIILSLINKQRRSIVSTSWVSSLSQEYINALHIKTPSHLQMVEYLSGGNQQKVLIAKMLASGCDVLVLIEPTEGIDVGTRYELYRLFRNLAEYTQKGIILISTDLDQILTLSDRVLVLSKHRFQECFPQQLTKQEIFEMALSSNQDSLNNVVKG